MARLLSIRRVWSRGSFTFRGSWWWRPLRLLEAYGLLKSSIRLGDPVLFIEHKRLYTMQEALPDDARAAADRASARRSQRASDRHADRVFGDGRRRRSKRRRNWRAKASPRKCIDLRTLLPLDMETIAASVTKTHRAVIAHEAVLNGGVRRRDRRPHRQRIVRRARCAGHARARARSCRFRLRRSWRRRCFLVRENIVRAARELRGHAVGLRAQQWHALRMEIPKVGLVMENARLVRWLKNVGDTRYARRADSRAGDGEVVVEIEAD